MLSGRPEPGGDQQGTQLIAVQGSSVRLAVQPRPPDMHGRRVIQKFFLDCVPVEPGNRAQAAGDGGVRPSA